MFIHRANALNNIFDPPLPGNKSQLSTGYIDEEIVFRIIIGNIMPEDYYEIMKGVPEDWQQKPKVLSLKRAAL